MNVAISDREFIMNHALIIDDNMIVSRAIQTRLEGMGFSSFDRTWNEEQAVAAAAKRTPDLIVVGDHVESGSPLQAVKRISGMVNVPVLMVTGDPWRARAQMEKTCAFEGPFLLNQIEEAVELAKTAAQPV
jgi:DNA-binding NtrC family response regulator